MPRRNYLVSYDISDDKRRSGVFKTLTGYGDRVQFSVFLCELSDTEHARLRTRLSECVKKNEDQVLILDLGSSARSLETAIETLGRPYQPCCRIQVV
jgi:CRISPR-associated protein Cas2